MEDGRPKTGDGRVGFLLIPLLGGARGGLFQSD